MITNLKILGPSNGFTRDKQGDYAVSGTIDGEANKIIAEFFNQVSFTVYLDAKSNAELFKQALITARLGVE